MCCLAEAADAAGLVRELAEARRRLETEQLKDPGEDIVFQLSTGGHSGAIQALAVSRDGSTMYSGGADGRIFRWNTGQSTSPVSALLGQSNPHKDMGEVSGLTMSPDGQRLVSCGRFTNVSGLEVLRLYDLTSGTLTQTVAISDDVNCVAYSDDGKFLVVGSRKFVWVFDGSSLQPIARWDVTKSALNVASMTDGTTLRVYAILSKQIVGWTLGSNESFKVVTERNEIGSIAVEPRSHRVAYAVFSNQDANDIARGGNGENFIVYCDAALGEINRCDHGQFGPGKGLAFSPDGQFVLTGAGALTSQTELMHPKLYQVQESKLQEYGEMKGRHTTDYVRWLTNRRVVVTSDAWLYVYDMIEKEDGGILMGDKGPVWARVGWHGASTATYSGSIDTVDWVGDNGLGFRRQQSGMRSTGMDPLEEVFDLSTRRLSTLSGNEAKHRHPVLDLQGLHVWVTNDKPGGWWTEKLVLSRGDNVPSADPAYGKAHRNRGGTEIYSDIYGSGWTSATLTKNRLYGMHPYWGAIVDTTDFDADGKLQKFALLDNGPAYPRNGAPSDDERWYAVGDKTGVITVWSLTDVMARGSVHVSVNSVALGGQAAAAGLQQGDVLDGMDGQRFQTYNAFDTYLDNHETVDFLVTRKGKRTDIRVTKKSGLFGFGPRLSAIPIKPAYYAYIISKPDEDGVKTSPEWVIWTPNGWFDCSPGGANLFSWQINHGALKSPDAAPANRLYERFFQPELVRRVIATGKADTVVAAELGLANDLAVSVRGVPTIVAVDQSERTVEGTVDSITIEFDVTDTGGGIGDVRFTVNGKRIDASERGMKPLTTVGTRSRHVIVVQLAPGENLVGATAYNTSQTASPEAIVRVTRQAPTAQGDLYLLIVGIDEYLNPRYRLSCSVSDATAFQKAIAASAPLFRQIKSRIILNREATRITIEAALKQIASTATPSDTFVLFYSGHGTLSEATKEHAAEFHLVTYDVTQLYGQDERLSQLAVPIGLVKALCASIAAQKQLILIDACNSGAATEAFATRGAGEERALLQMARATGAAVIAASAGDQTAKEIKALGHGIFTQALLEGMAGQAKNAQGIVTVRSIDAWLQTKVPELAEKYGLSPQWPMSLCRGNDFPLAPPSGK